MQRVFLVLFLSVVAAVPQRTTRIVGGSPTAVDRYPFMSNMQYEVWGIWWMQYCGGSLITTTAVLSAAHCYHGDSPSSWRVVLGSSLASGSNGSLHLVSQLIVNADFNSITLDYDVAIVKLSTPAKLSNKIGLARIAGTNYNLTDGLTVYAIGWGALRPGGVSPTQLQHVDLNIINQQICTERYAHLKTQPGYETWPNVSAGMLCAGILDVGGKDACQGDSGGPLTHNGDVVVGITSWGYSCADEQYPGVNTRVSAYTKWIMDRISNNYDIIQL